LLTRYADFPGAPDLRDDLAKVLRLWGLDLSQLQGRTRAIWSAGFQIFERGPLPVARAFLEIRRLAPLI
jgi:hypothetical protein